MIHAIVQAVSTIGGGGESSPLSPSSQLSELLRVMQFAIAGGVWYLINQIRKNRNTNDEAHGEVQNDIRNVANQVNIIKEEMQHTRAEVNQIKQQATVIKDTVTP